MSRPIHLILKTNEQGKKFCNVMFHSGAAERYLTCIKIVACLRCDICMCMKAEEIWRSTYVTAWQNKLEYNYPTMFCCCMIDQVGVIYYDRDILGQTAKAECCKPCCTHCSPCPTCCDICGEGLVLYGASCFSTNLTAIPGLRCMCGRCYTILTNLDDVQALSNAINTSRQKAMQEVETYKRAPGAAAIN